MFLLKIHLISALLLFVSFTAGSPHHDSFFNERCLHCLCNAVSSCDKTAPCYGEVCGPFKITWAYWVDAGKPTLRGQLADSELAYKNCAMDYHCSVLTVQQYMKKFEQDCNGDGVIDCDDFAAIHQHGGYGCRGASIMGDYKERYHQCLLKS